MQQGASTLDQQYVKNYQLLVVAKTDAERRAAIETTPARKIREIRMALTLDKELTKDEILTRYLNLVPFGNGSFGIQDAAQTYFGVDAADLTVPQSAMLAGMVQSSSALNPYTNVEGVTERRNTVLDTMITNIPDRADEFRAAKEEPLGVLETPNNLPRGCIAAGDRGFFCDYALKYLSDAGITRDQINEGGYLIKTTLDPQVQASTKAGLNANASANLDGIANVMNVIRPGQDSHKVIAMASSRTYGLNADADETVQAQPYSLAGDGAGSVFKIFTTAAAMEKGLGINATLDVPKRFEAKGMGSGGAAGCPVSTYCVENAGNYPPTLSVTDAWHSPQTPLSSSSSRRPASRRRSTWLSASACARTPIPTPRASTSAAWPTSRRNKTSVRSPSAPPGSTRSNSPTSRPLSPRTASGARRVPSIRYSTATASRWPSPSRAVSRSSSPAWQTHSPTHEP